MSFIKFANVVLEQSPRSLKYPSLYCSSTGPFIPSREAGEKGVWKLLGPGVYDFTTYFNSLSVMKLQRYTVAKGFRLHLELKGAACTVTQTKAGVYTRETELNEDVKVEVAESAEWREYDIDLQVGDSDVVIGFMIVTEGEVDLRSSFYSVEVDDTAIRSVELALATTTFKKEDFILSNIELMRKEVENSPSDPIAGHFTMHVVDNGRTLDAEALTEGCVHVYPNNNVGGAGGFARGMIEAMRQQPVKATHVLLMDDDVAINPESIKRTFNLLRIANEEYSDAFVSGAMLNYSIGEDLWEDLGYMTKEGFCRPVKSTLRFSLLHDIVINEILEPTEEQSQTYCAWWYCCIPMSTIEKKGLPLPVFVRFDDVEYGLRCKPKIMSMNGICIWHLEFHSRYNAAVERYQTTRNSFIGQMTTGMAPESDFIMELRNSIQVELKKFNYTNAELALDGFEDFLKGPDFISQPVAEDCFMRANRNAEKLIPFEELDEQLSELDGSFDLHDLNEIEVNRDDRRTRPQAAIDFLSFNGQRFPFGGSKDKRFAIVPAAGWSYLAGKLHAVDTVVAIDVFNKKGIIRHKDVKRFKEVWDRYKRDIRYYKRHKDDLQKAYSAASSKLTSVEFWKGYLGID